MDRAAVDPQEVADVLRSGLTAGRRGGISWFGTTHGDLAPAVWNAMAPAARTAFRVEMLANHLYPHLYCHGQVVADPAELPVHDDGVDLAAALREAHGGVTVADPA
ncbi:MAG: hypothetical protein LPK38_01555, partial [Actinomycetes bacterium]|nr:hypothetical protein [Actinomycetes bacterium]MDX5380004.1 hypothetical protein [Actinomycetes bacterium]MDX5398546.1 hypothetical protein [Actinomycetes bacterium]MDX5449700.1 hypothetical protein [Actinomycetes bacterium]